MPGEVEYYREQECMKNGFPLSAAAIAQLNKLSDDFGVARLC